MRMQKWMVLGGMLAMLAGCSEKDPILPGTRTAIFQDSAVVVRDMAVTDLPAASDDVAPATCPYTQDASNIIWDGARRVFSGFSTGNTVNGPKSPVCRGGFVYAGLSTGEVVKVNPKTRKIAWIADVYRPSNLTGGASVLDIVAPLVVTGDGVYAAGLGDAFCRIRDADGAAVWCVDIGTAHPIILAGPAAFVMATDGNVYAVRRRDGAVYWRTPVARVAAPTYDAGVITVGRQKIDAATGKLL